MTDCEYAIHDPLKLYQSIGPVFHFNAIALDPETNKQVVYHPNNFENKNEGLFAYDTSFQPSELIYSPESITKMMQTAHEYSQSAN